MRQASWNEMFATRPAAGVAKDVPQEPSGWRRLFWWEDAITFVLLGVLVLAVIHSVYRSQWVDTMPSLYPVTFFGLLLGAMLARLRWPEALIHLLALPIGAAASLATILSIVPGPTPWARYDELHARMAEWFNIAFNGGISNDDLPFIVLVVPLAWLAAYLSAWAVFRWQNAWLALIPSGLLLLSNISYFSGQFSFAAVIFLIAGVLLITRLHLMSQAKAWRETETPYPEFLSLSVMHITLWLTAFLLVGAWVLPNPGQSDALEGVWADVTTPIADRVEPLSRLFVSVRGKSSLVHSHEDFLAFQGAIELPDTQVLDAEVAEELDQRGLLRGQTFDTYTGSGWEQSDRNDLNLAAGEVTEVDAAPDGDTSLQRLLLLGRLSVPVEIEASGDTGDAAFTIGQPLQVDKDATISARTLSDISRVEIVDGLRDESTYETIGSISLATEEELRHATSGFPRYPSYIVPFYTDLPLEMQRGDNRVYQFARELTNDQPTGYDKVRAIEDHLRTFPIDYSIPDTPQGRDTVDYFLFDLQRGYFDYHASAMVVLLRSIGIPSRLAVGYVLDPRDRIPNTNRYLVTEESAYAWPEVYFPGYGWVEFNPTPDQPRVERPGAVADVEPPMLEPNDVPSTLGLEDLPGQIGAEDAGGALTLDEGSSSNRNLWIALSVLGGLLTVAALATATGYFLWVRGLAGASIAERRWEQLSRLATWSGTPPDRTQTPHEFASTLRERVRGAGEVELLADAYVEQQFGDRDVPDDSRLAEVWESVRNGLFRKLLRLK
jgi:transglutaminase-like putative cysteine protease